jgi:hypothetical protein
MYAFVLRPSSFVTCPMLYFMSAEVEYCVMQEALRNSLWRVYG